MRTTIGCFAVLASVMGMAVEAVAMGGYEGATGNRSLSSPSPVVEGTTLNPRGVAVDMAGNLYFVDNSNLIRKISPSGKISVVAGSGEKGHANN